MRRTYLRTRVPATSHGARSLLPNGTPRTLEKWTVTGCGRAQLWEVVFHPGVETDVSFAARGRRKQQ
jgi:hypothetical protein